MKHTVDSQLRQFLCGIVVAIGSCCPLLTANAQTIPDPSFDEAKAIDEITVTVNRAGKPVDANALRLEEIRLKVIREFNLEQTKQEEEFSRLKLRSSRIRNTSRVAWGYDAQKEAARLQYSQARYLPIDRVRPATILSVRF